jgi:hypothetical protein
MTSGAEVWFYGGDILARPEVPSSMSTNAAVLQLGPKPHSFRAFGTSLRSLPGTATNLAQFGGVSIPPSGVFHIHGGIINADASAATFDVNATALTSNGAAHAYETAFLVKGAGTGFARRLVGSGDIDAPFLWRPSSSPPDIDSLNGNDLFVDTEAGTGDNEAHLMVYDAGCAAELGGPWRDMVTGACREP